MNKNLHRLPLVAAISACVQFFSGRDEVFLVIDLAMTVEVLPPLVGNMALWGLYVAVFYIFFQMYVDELASDKPLTTILATISVCYAIVTVRQLGWVQFTGGVATAGTIESASMPPFFPELAAVSVVGTILICAYTTRNYGSIVFETPLESLYRQVAPKGAVEDIQFIRRQDDWVKHVGVVAAATAILSVVLAGSFYLGATTAVVAAFFPLFELVLIGTGAVSVLTASRLNPISIEDDVQRIAQGVFMNFKGLAVAPMLFCGIAWALVPLFVGFVEGITAIEALSHSVGPERPLGNMVADFGIVGFGILPALAGLLMIRYWWHIARRVPTFLRQTQHPDADETPPTFRQPLMLVPAVLLLLLSIVPTTGRLLWQAGYLGDVRHPLWVFAILWPICVVATVYWLYRSRRVSVASQSIRSDRIHMPLAFGVQTCGILVWSGIVGDPWLIELATGSAEEIPAFVGQGLIVTGVVIAIAVTPEIYEWSRTTSTPVVRSGLVGGFAGVIIWLGLSDGNALVIASGLVLIPFAAFEGVLAVVKTKRSSSIT